MQVRNAAGASQAAQNGDVIPATDLPKDCVCAITLQTDADNAANADVVPQISLDGVTFITLPMITLLDGTTVVLKLTGASKASRIDGISARQIKVVRTDANAGLCRATLSISQRRP